jgi:hypothetical protein
LAVKVWRRWFRNHKPAWAIIIGGPSMQKFYPGTRMRCEREKLGLTNWVLHPVQCWKLTDQRIEAERILTAPKELPFRLVT